MKKVVGLGACVYDTLISCENYPKEDTKQRAENVFVSGGGPVSNALVVMSKLGVRAEYIGVLAKDAAGDYLLKDFADCGVGTAGIVRAGSRSFTSYILLSERGNTRTCVFDRGNAPDDPQLLDFTRLDGADVLHLDGNSLQCALAAAKYAQAHGIKVSLDAGGLYEGIENLLPYIDILIPSAEFAQGITGKKDIAGAMQMLQNKYSPEVLVVTDGKNGGFYWEECPKHYNAVKVKAADTNGAGDTFHGAFLTAYLHGKRLSECCRYASAVSAYKCMYFGTRHFSLNKYIAEKLFLGVETKE